MPGWDALVYSDAINVVMSLLFCKIAQYRKYDVMGVVATIFFSDGDGPMGIFLTLYDLKDLAVTLPISIMHKYVWNIQRLVNLTVTPGILLQHFLLIIKPHNSVAEGGVGPADNYSVRSDTELMTLIFATALKLSSSVLLHDWVQYPLLV